MLRTSAERPEAVEAGYARVMGFEKEAIWDGTGEAARRIVDVIDGFLERWALPARTFAPPLSSPHPSPSQGPGPSIRPGPKLLLSRYHTTGDAGTETRPCPIRLPELWLCSGGVMAQAHQALRGQVHPLREMVQVPQAERASAADTGLEARGIPSDDCLISDSMLVEMKPQRMR